MNLLKIYPKTSSILMIGPYPPILGGVSIHIKRLKHLLQNNGFQVDVFNTAQAQRFKGQNTIKLTMKILGNNFKIIHVHGYPYNILRIIMVMRKIKKFKLYITDHNPRLFEKHQDNNGKTNFYKRIIPDLDCLVVVASHILEEYRKYGVTSPDNTLIHPSFIPPDLNEEATVLKTYPKELSDFIGKHKPLLTANAFRLTFYNGVDLYGLDLCVELAARLKQKFPMIGFLFALADENHQLEYLEKIKKRIIKLGIKNNFYFMSGQKEIWPLFKKTDLMIRPTYNDGYGISIAESLYFGCPAIASDVCLRPEGTILFKNRDLNDLMTKVMIVLKKVSDSFGFI